MKQNCTNIIQVYLLAACKVRGRGLKGPDPSYLADMRIKRPECKINIHFLMIGSWFIQRCFFNGIGGALRMVKKAVVRSLKVIFRNLSGQASTSRNTGRPKNEAELLKHSSN
jgi:hypothetical protein